MIPQRQAEALGRFWEGFPGPPPASEAPAEELAAYRQKLEAWNEQFGDTGPPDSPAAPPVIPPPTSTGAGLPAARLGDLIAHGGSIGPAVTGLAARVFIADQPAACVSDPTICPMYSGPKPHVGGAIMKGSSTVLIGDMPAARVSDQTICTPEPGAIAAGAANVLIGDATAGGAVCVVRTAPEVGRETQSVVDARASGRTAIIAAVDPDHAGPLVPAELPGPPETTWIGVKLRDFDGRAMPNQDFIVRLNTGQVLVGRTDARGYMRFEGVRPDRGDVTFVEIPDESARAPTDMRDATAKSDSWDN